MAAVFSSLMQLLTTNVNGRTSTVVGVCCVLCESRRATDIGMRADVAKVEALDLTRRLSAGVFKVIEPPLGSHSFYPPPADT